MVVECEGRGVRQYTRCTSRHKKYAKLPYPLVPVHHEDGHVRPLGVVAATHLHLQEYRNYETIDYSIQLMDMVAHSMYTVGSRIIYSILFRQAFQR